MALIYAQSFDQKVSGHNALTVVWHNMTPTVRQMTLPSAGIVLYYAPRKFNRGTAQEERRAGQFIPVAAGQ